MVEEDYDHVNEDVNDGLIKKDDDVTKSIVGLKLEQSKNSHGFVKMTNMKMKGKRLKSRRSQREVRIDDCEYSGAYDKCGDKFLSIFSDYKCGYEIFNIRASCQALGPGPGLCLIHFNSFTSLRLRTLDQRADAIIQMHPPTHNF